MDTIKSIGEKINYGMHLHEYGLSTLFCTSSALVRDQPQLLESLKNAESIVLMYDVARLETLTHLDTFWLPLIEANTEASVI